MQQQSQTHCGPQMMELTSTVKQSQQRTVPRGSTRPAPLHKRLNLSRMDPTPSTQQHNGLDSPMALDSPAASTISPRKLTACSSTGASSSQLTPPVSPRSPRNNTTSTSSSRLSGGNPQIVVHDYAMSRLIGEGASGRVFLAEHTTRQGEMAAIKVVRKGLGKTAKRARKEANFMQLMKHSNIVKLKECVETKQNLFLIQEYVNGGDLFDFMQNYTKLSGRYALPSEMSWNVFTQLALALGHAHGKGIIHRDIKPENIFLDAEGNAKLGDWGYATFWNSSQPKQKSCGSSFYAAPEILLNKPYTGPEIDVFSLGGVLYTMLTGGLPFGYVGRDSNDAAVKRALRGSWIPNSLIDPQTAQLLNHMLHPVALQRATLYDVILFLRQRVAMQEPVVVPTTFVGASPRTTSLATTLTTTQQQQQPHQHTFEQQKHTTTTTTHSMTTTTHSTTTGQYKATWHNAYPQTRQMSQ